MPPILAGHQTPQLRAPGPKLYAGVAELFERWAARRPSHHTQRAYRRDVLSFVDFLGLLWPQDAFRLLLASGRRRAALARRHDGRNQGPQRPPRPSTAASPSLSSFYKYLAGGAAELVNVPNPAHAQFIARESSDPLEGTRALTATRARQLMGFLPATTCSISATVPSSKPTSTPASGLPAPAGCACGTFTRRRGGHPHHQRERQPPPHHRNPFRRSRGACRIHWESWTCGRADFPGAPRAQQR